MDLFEGLIEGDLEGLVLPLISLDEFETKLDDEAIVVAFFVQDRDPANDLNRFIQKGAISILDTDVSPAPNEDGYYLVFVELERNAELSKRLLDLLSSLTGLTGIKTWRGTFFEQEGVHDITPENITALLHFDVEEQNGLAESLSAFFKDSALQNMWVEGRFLQLEGLRDQYHLEIVDFGSFDEVKEHNPVLSQGMRLDETAQRTMRGLRRALGDHWLVEHLQGHVVISQPWVSSDVLLLKV